MKRYLCLCILVCFLTSSQVPMPNNSIQTQTLSPQAILKELPNKAQIESSMLEAGKSYFTDMGLNLKRVNIVSGAQALANLGPKQTPIAAQYAHLATVPLRGAFFSAATICDNTTILKPASDEEALYGQKTGFEKVAKVTLESNKTNTASPVKMVVINNAASEGKSDSVRTFGVGEIVQPIDVLAKNVYVIRDHLKQQNKTSLKDALLNLLAQEKNKLETAFNQLVKKERDAGRGIDFFEKYFPYNNFEQAYAALEEAVKKIDETDRAEVFQENIANVINLLHSIDERDRFSLDFKIEFYNKMFMEYTHAVEDPVECTAGMARGLQALLTGDTSNNYGMSTSITAIARLKSFFLFDKDFIYVMNLLCADPNVQLSADETITENLQRIAKAMTEGDISKLRTGGLYRTRTDLTFLAMILSGFLIYSEDMQDGEFKDLCKAIQDEVTKPLDPNKPGYNLINIFINEYNADVLAFLELDKAENIKHLYAKFVNHLLKVTKAKTGPNSLRSGNVAWVEHGEAAIVNSLGITKDIMITGGGIAEAIFKAIYAYIRNMNILLFFLGKENTEPGKKAPYGNKKTDPTKHHPFERLKDAPFTKAEQNALNTTEFKNKTGYNVYDIVHHKPGTPIDGLVATAVILAANPDLKTIPTPGIRFNPNTKEVSMHVCIGVPGDEDEQVIVEYVSDLMQFTDDPVAQAAGYVFANYYKDIDPQLEQFPDKFKPVAGLIKAIKEITRSKNEFDPDKNEQDREFLYKQLIRVHEGMQALEGYHKEENLRTINDQIYGRLYFKGKSVMRALLRKMKKHLKQPIEFKNDPIAETAQCLAIGNYEKAGEIYNAIQDAKYSERRILIGELLSILSGEKAGNKIEVITKALKFLNDKKNKETGTPASDLKNAVYANLSAELSRILKKEREQAVPQKVDTGIILRTDIANVIPVEQAV